ncbi:helix-turn-helix transcriptional regulator [Streptomyces sp. HNM0663]|uniref:Helix-turn-helix transcriptional regulator n=1 Tax=Streptomyces chengmaiensis TaxID=3040919 RepID=A0ABT6HVK4_9ACTN|nr:helix-turn-helix transcriptional regulator [Streptomyces chengmaiensis]MDH2392357.1 helix-turn-helix transcriptional regulator [Streptomyces chengmaiensis]
MTTDSKRRPLAAIVGERLRMLREAKGLRQEDVADAAREFGLNWGRSSIAALEQGSRNLDFEELIVLASVLRKLGGWEEPLIPSHEVIALNEQFNVYGYQLPAFMMNLTLPSARPAGSGEEGRTLNEEEALGSIETEPAETEEERLKRVARDVKIHDYILYSLWPDYEEPKRRRSSEMRGLELSRRIAERITLPDGSSLSDWFLVVTFAQGLWGRVPADERDARTEARGDYATKRALQSARGHVTRELIEELQEAFNARWSEVQAAYDELESVIDDPKKLKQWIRHVNSLEDRAKGIETPERKARRRVVVRRKWKIEE